MTAYFLGSGTEASPGRIGRFRAANRAMTQAEMSAQFFAGVAEVDRGASQVPIYISDFSAGVDGWALSGNVGALAGNIDGVSDGVTSKDNCLRFTTNNASQTKAIYKHPIYTAARNYLTKISIYVPPGQTYIDGFRVYVNSFTGTLVFDGTGVNGQWVDVSVPHLAESAFLVVYPYDDTSASINALANGELLYIHGVELRQIGNTVNLSPAGIQLAPGQWLDNSGNRGHVHIPDGCRLLNPETDGDLRGINTWSASDTLQYFNGLNANIFASNAYVNNMIIVPTVSYAGGFNIGDGANETYYAEIAGPVAANIPIEVGLKTSVNDGTNRKLTIKPTAAYTGSVKTTIFCGSVEA